MNIYNIILLEFLVKSIKIINEPLLINPLKIIIIYKVVNFRKDLHLTLILFFFSIYIYL